MTEAPGPVFVGVLTFTVETPGARSLKEKRSLVKPLVERLRARYPVSVARLDGLDLLGEETVGAVTLSADAAVCRSVLERALAFAEGQGMRVRAPRVEVERWD